MGVIETMVVVGVITAQHADAGEAVTTSGLRTASKRPMTANSTLTVLRKTTRRLGSSVLDHCPLAGEWRIVFGPLACVDPLVRLSP